MPQPAATPRTRSLRAAIALGLVAACFAVYAEVRHHEFVDYDDYKGILHRQELEVASLREALAVALSPHHANWVPLSTLSHQLDRRLYGVAPAGHLLTNVALHALASAVLFLALAAMTGATGRSAFVAAVFAVHPLHVESVAWASERKDVLCGLFWMLTLAAHAGQARHPGSLGRRALVLLCLTLALLAKPVAVTLPCVLLLLDYWPLARLSRRTLVEKLPMFVLVAALCAVTLAVQRGGGSLEFGAGIPLAARVANAVDASAIYVLKSFWPSQLAAFYPHPGEGLSPLRVALAALLLAAASAAAVALRRTRPWLLVGWLWFLGTLVPVLGLVQVGLQARADRYTYLPQTGLAIALAWQACDLWRGRAARRVLAALALFCVLALGAAARLQVATWRDSNTLFERMLAVSPEAYPAHAGLAKLHLAAGRLEQAERHYERAFAADPGRGRANLVLFQLGMAELASGRGARDEALRRLRRAVEVDPDGSRARLLLGTALLRAGRREEARQQLEAALTASPPQPAAHLALASLSSVEGREADAAAHYRRALELDPDLGAVRNDLAWLLATTRDAALRSPAEAVALAEAQRARQGAPSANLLDTLAAAYAADGRFADALRTAQEALTLAQRERNTGLAEQIERRLRAYAAGRPWREPPDADPSSGGMGPP
jgi:tetratricopeptide (TPR) repeat protein